MPNTKSAEKRTRSNTRKQQRNRSIKSQLGTLERQFEKLVGEKKSEEARSTLTAVSSAYDRAAKKGVIHRNKANHKKSRLSAALNALATN